MSASPPRAGAWVSLGVDDVQESDLAGRGSAREAVLPAEVTIGIDEAVAALLPADGWREVRTPRCPAAISTRRLFAAPHAGGWALAHLADTPTGPILSGDPGPYAVRPSRAARRAGLELRWPAGVRCHASELNGLTVTLVNAGEEPWHGDPDDHGYVHGWLLHRDGDRLGPGWFAYGPLARQLPTTLAPGEGRPLPVDFGPSAAETAPGSYGVAAVLVAFDLRSAPGVVHIR